MPTGFGKGAVFVLPQSSTTTRPGNNKIMVRRNAIVMLVQYSLNCSLSKYECSWARTCWFLRPLQPSVCPWYVLPIYRRVLVY